MAADFRINNLIAQGGSFTERPTVNGTGVLLEGDSTTGSFLTTGTADLRYVEIADLPVYQTGNQIISGTKTFHSGLLVQNGNVGIGTLTPTSKLEVVGDSKISGNLNITNYNTGVNALDRFTIDGAAGRLFGVSDSVTGTIFSVNDAAGLPIIEVESNLTDKITMGTYGSNALVVNNTSVGIGTATPSGKLEVIGDTKISGNLIFTDGATRNISGASATVAGAGTSLNIRGGNANTAGVGGSINLIPGIGAGGPGNGDINIGSSTLGAAQAISLYAPTTTINYTGPNLGTPLIINGGGRELMSFNWDNINNVTSLKSSSSSSIRLSGALDYQIMGSTPTSSRAALNVVNSNNSSIAYFRNDNKVGIGTTSPAGKLHIEGSLTSTPGSTDSSIMLGQAGTTYGAIRLSTDGSFNIDSNVGTWQTTPSLTILRSSQNVGIGVASPLSKLTVNGNILLGTGNMLAPGINLNATDGYNTIGFGSPGSWFMGINAQSSNESINITDANSTWPGTPRVTFLRGGNVGIGTGTPNSKLTIRGSATSETISNIFDSTGLNRFSLSYDANGTTINSNGGVGTSALILRSTNNSSTTVAAHNGSVNINPGPYDGNNSFEFGGGGIINSYVINVATAKTQASRISTSLHDNSGNYGQIYLQPYINGNIQAGLIVKSITGGGANVGINTINPAAKLDILDTTLAGSAGLSGSALNIAQTWNTTGTPTSIKLNVTDTLSNTASKLLDLQLTGYSRLNLSKAGILSVSDIDTANRQAAVKIIQSDRNVTLIPGAFGGNGFGLTGPTFYQALAQNSSLAFSASNSNDTVSFFRLFNDNISDTIAQRNTTSPQAYRLYNTYTSDTNFERLNLKWDSTGVKIGTEKGSAGGALRPIEFQINGVNSMTLATNGNVGVGTTTPTYPLDVSGAINSRVVGASVNFVAQNPGDTYPRGKMLIDYNNSAPSNVGFTVAPAYGTNAEFYPVFLSVDNNKVATNSGYRQTLVYQGAGYASIGAIGGANGSSAGDPLKFSTQTFLGNNSALVIGNDTNQKVTIGSDTIGASQLNVVARGSLNAATFTNGNIGIGTTSPTNLLHIYSEVGNGTAQLLVQNDTNTAVPIMQFLRRRGTGTAVVQGDSLGRISALASKNSSANLQAGYIEFQANGSPAGFNNVLPSKINFVTLIDDTYAGYTNSIINGAFVAGGSGGQFIFNKNDNIGGDYAPDVGISRLGVGKIGIGNATAGTSTGTLIAGNIGIGITTPTNPLHIYGTTADQGIILDSVSNPRFSILRAGTERLRFNAVGNIGMISAPGGNGLMLGGAADANNLFINSAGNVGIGTGTPTEKLDVAGNVKVSGALSTNTLGVSGASVFNSSAAFTVRPTVNGSGVLLIGDSATGAFLTTGVADLRYVAQTGNQTISGVKTFATGLLVQGDIQASSITTSSISTNSSTPLSLQYAAAGTVAIHTDLNIVPSGGSISINNDTFLTRRGAANFRLGAADAAAPVAQTLSVQSVVAGTTNTAGGNLTVTSSQGTGTGVGGSIIFQVAPAGTSGTSQNALIPRVIFPATSAGGVAIAFNAIDSSNVALRSSGTTLDILRADASSYANLTANNITAQGTISTSYAAITSNANVAATTGEQISFITSTTSNGTVANGFGTRIALRTQSSTTVARDSGAIAAIWSDATDATRTSDLLLYNTLSGTLTERLRILGTNGNVGIGTTTPSEKLEVSGGNIKINGVNNASLTINKQNAANNASIIFTEANVTKATIQTNTLGEFLISGPNSVKTELGAGNSGTLALSAAASGTMTFSTNNSERIRILTNGNVGIGTSTPTDKLHVNGGIKVSGDFATWSANTGTLFYQGGKTGLLSVGPDASTIGGFLFRCTDSTGAATAFNAISVEPNGCVGVGFSNPTTYTFSVSNTAFTGTAGNWGKIGQVYMTGASGGAYPDIGYNMRSQTGGGAYLFNTTDSAAWISIDGNFRFKTGGSGTAGAAITATERLTILSSNGNVGIGRTTPLAKLDVDGTAFINATSDGSTGAKLTVGGTGSTIYTPGSVWATGGLVLSSGNTISSVTVNGSNIVNIGGGGIQLANGGPVLSYLSGTGIKVLQTNGITYGSVNAGTLALGSTYAGTAAPANGAIIEGNVGIGTNTPSEKLEVVGNAKVSGHFSAATKSFLIPHPTKAGKQLQYGVVESNQHSVLVRGKTSEAVIELPEEWIGLVHEDSVTVQLTPIGSYQQLFVVSQNNQKIVVGGSTGEYNYTVYGERKDVDKLITEI